MISPKMIKHYSEGQWYQTISKGKSCGHFIVKESVFPRGSGITQISRLKIR